jgi:DNA-directed RNA polymerase specialized sigma24 family protein
MDDFSGNNERAYNSEFAMSQREIGAALNISATCVMDTERRAMKKIKKILEERGIKIEDLIG